MQATRELAPDVWSEYFDAVSRELLNARASIEIIAESAPPVVEAERLALQQLTYDRRDDVFEIAVARTAPDMPGTVRHLVDHPTRVAVDSHTMLAPMTIAVDDHHRVRTVITIKQDAEFTGPKAGRSSAR